MSIGIVIVNYNGAKIQNDCIRTIYASDYKDFEIIVVDSGSTDGSIQMLREEFPNVRILEQHENVGVAVGNNIGIRESKRLGMDYTMLMNNDIEISTDLIRILLDNADKHTISVPKIYYYYPKDKIWFAGGELDWEKGSAVHFGIDEIDTGKYDDDKIISYAPTCCMLIHNSVFDNIGYIDETVFMYFDDTDLCARLQQAGYKIKYVPEAVMWHKVSSSSGGERSKTNVYYMTRNHLYYMDKYKDKVSWYTKPYVHMKDFAKYVLSPVRYKNERYIKKAYDDYKKGMMGRVDL